MGLFARLLGLNSWTFYVTFAWGRGREVEKLLLAEGISITNRGISGGELFFDVALDKAVEAQRIMQRAGVPLRHGAYPGGIA